MANFKLNRLFLLPEVIVESARLSLSSSSKNSSSNSLNQSTLSGTCHLTIPPSASPSIHDNGHLIHISYIIRAQQSDLLVECPILIGTYPIDLDEKPQVIIQPSPLKGVAYQEVLNGNEFNHHHQISSLHHSFLEATAKIHHSSIHSCGSSSFSNLKKKNRTSSLYDDEEYNDGDEGLTSIYSMSSSRENI